MTEVLPPAAVSREIANRNPWYVGSQFEWADQACMRRIYRKRRQFLAQCLARAKARSGRPLRVLDAGCGDGYWLATLGQIGGLEMTGVDYNPLRAGRARQAAGKARVLTGDLADLATGETFDVVLLNQVLEHVPADEELLRTVRGILRADGLLILGAPNEGSWLQQRRLRRQGPECRTDHVHFYTEAELRAKIARAGFRVDRVMREVFYPGQDRLYYRLTSSRWGYGLLTGLTWLWPAGCSDFYFECRADR